MPVLLREKAREKGTYIVAATFRDESGDLICPLAATWTLTNDAGTVINSREDVTISTSIEVEIVMSGDDLALSGVNDNGERIVTVEATYDSTYGKSLPLKESFIFYIDDLRAVS